MTYTHAMIHSDLGRMCRRCPAVRRDSTHARVCDGPDCPCREERDVLQARLSARALREVSDE